MVRLVLRMAASPFAPLLFAVGYFVCAVVAFALTGEARGFVTLWPPTGLLLAVLLIVPKRAIWRYVFAAGVAGWLASVVSRFDLLLAAGFTFANLLAVLLATLLMRRGRTEKLAFVDPQGLGPFVGWTLLSAAAGSLFVSAVQGSGNVHAILSFFAAVWLGMLLVTPPLVALYEICTSYRKPVSLPRWGTLARIAAISVLAGAVTFLQPSLPLLFIPMTVVMIGVLRGGSVGGIISVLVMALLGSWGLTLGLGPVSLIDASWSFKILFFQLYLVMLFCAAWPMAHMLADRERLRIDLAERLRLLDQAESAGKIGHWRVDPGDNSIFWSPQAYRIHGQPQGDAPSFDQAIEFYHPEDRPIVTAAVTRALEKGLPFEFHARIIRADGEVRHIVSRGEKDYSSRDDAIGLFGIVQDVTEMVEARLRLVKDRDAAERSADAASELANTDVLTGFANRRRMLERLRQLTAAGKQSTNDLSIVLFDIDHFKSVNDRFGHDVGDRVLKSVASVASEELRKTDLIGRYGGEEFLLLLPGTGTRAALQIAERVRGAIERNVGEAHPPVTVSLGVATLTPSETVDSLLKRADVALYDAKAAGRNRLQFAA